MMVKRELTSTRRIKAPYRPIITMWLSIRMTVMKYFLWITVDFLITPFIITNNLNTTFTWKGKWTCILSLKKFMTNIISWKNHSIELISTATTNMPWLSLKGLWDYRSGMCFNINSKDWEMSYSTIPSEMISTN